MCAVCWYVGAVTGGANCCTVCHLLSMNQLRSQVKQEDVKVKEGVSTHAVCCVCVWAHHLVTSQGQSTCHRRMQPRASVESLGS